MFDGGALPGVAFRVVQAETRAAYVPSLSFSFVRWFGLNAYHPERVREERL